MNMILKYKQKFFFCCLCILALLFSLLCPPAYGGEPSESELFSLSATLMDADSGRILYSKDGSTMRANASTTKILTCILALEYGNPDDLVTVSKYAASMPDVQLNINTGEQYYLKDLLYSLMLESHNDTAVAIAEHIGGSVEEFTDMMNEKASDIGCVSTHFITPNGLDATETIDGTEYFHGTSSEDLCRIMAYCIKNEEFLKITQTASHSFTNYTTGDDGNVVSGSRNFSVQNKNAFLSMMDGVISGKTGFTGTAGYCYVTALRQGDRTFTVALLGCGWPNNKTYKWHDAKLLLEYGLENFSKKDLYEYDKTLPEIPVENGITDPLLSNGIFADRTPTVKLSLSASPLIIMVKDTDISKVDYHYPRQIKAPVHAGDVLGIATYTLNGEVIQKYNIYAAETVVAFDFPFCIRAILKNFLL